MWRDGSCRVLRVTVVTPLVAVPLRALSDLLCVYPSTMRSSGGGGVQRFLNSSQSDSPTAFVVSRPGCGSPACPEPRDEGFDAAVVRSSVEQEITSSTSARRGTGLKKWRPTPSRTARWPCRVHDRGGGRVVDEDGVADHDLVRRAEALRLRRLVLGDGLDDQVAVGEVPEVGSEGQGTASPPGRPRRACRCAARGRGSR